MTPATLVHFLDREVTVRELTLGNVISLLRSADEVEPISVDLLLDLPGAAAVICAATGLTMDDLDRGTPTEVTALLAEVEQLNPHYAAAARRLKKEMERLQKMMSSQTALNGLDADLLSEAALKSLTGRTGA